MASLVVSVIFGFARPPIRPPRGKPRSESGNAISHYGQEATPPAARYDDDDRRLAASRQSVTAAMTSPRRMQTAGKNTASACCRVDNAQVASLTAPFRRALNAHGNVPGSVAEIFRIPRADLGKLAERARQMGAQMLLGLVGIAGVHRFSDQPVMTHDILRLAGEGRQPAQPSICPLRLFNSVQMSPCRRRRKLGWNSLSAAMARTRRPCRELLLARDRSVQLGDEGLVMAYRGAAHDFSFAWRRKCACCANRTSTRLTTVAYCGNSRPGLPLRAASARRGSVSN